MNLPSIVRIGSIGDGTFDVFVQPNISVPRAYDSLARISAVQLRFVRHGAPAAEEPEFSWFDSGYFGEFEDGASAGPMRPTLGLSSSAPRNPSVR